MSELIIYRRNGERLALDVVENAQFSRSVILPRHPVDPGALGGTATVVNDSAVLQPKDFTVRCRIATEQPVGTLPTLGVLTSSRREEDAVDFLEEIVGEYVDVQVPKFRLQRDVQLAAFPHELTRSRSTPFQLAFSAAGFAGRGFTVLPRVVQRAKPDLPPEVDDGETLTREAPEEKAAPVRASILKRLGR